MKIQMIHQKRFVVRELIIFSLLFCNSQAYAIISSGGDMQLVNSVIDNGGGDKLSGGEYTSRGSIGRASMPENLGLEGGGEYVNRAGFYNPPYFTYQTALPTAFASAAGDVNFVLPENAVDKEYFDITYNKNPLNEPTAVDPEKIRSAMLKMVNNEGGWAQLYPNNLSELAIFDEQGYYTKAFAKKGTMVLNYKDDNGDGILDGSNPPVRVETLNGWALDENMALWSKLPNEGLDKSSKSLRLYFGMPGVYALLGSMDQSVKDAYAFPVPFRPNGPQAGSGQGQTGTEAGGITFNNVPQSGNVEIYTLDGRLVKKLSIPAGLVLPKIIWDVKNASGSRAASGVYIWRVVSGNNTKTGKLMVIW